MKAHRFDIAIIPPEGRVNISGDYSEWPLLKAQVKNDHLKISDLDISNIIYISSRLVSGGEGLDHITLDLYTESTIINYYPYDEFEASVWFDTDVMRLIYLKIGDTISASGALNIKDRPHRGFFRLTLSDFDVSRPFIITGVEDEPLASGAMSGELLLQGELDKLETGARLEVKDGTLGTVGYKNMILNIRGLGPMLTVFDSRIIREDSFLVLAGTADIREIGQDRFLEDIIISSDENTIIWDGWDISKMSGDDQLSLSKSVSKSIKVDFKAQTGGDETAYEPVKQESELGLEYDIPDKTSSIQYKAKESEEFLGMVKKYKF